MSPQIFVDLDGVLADFYGHYKTQFNVDLNYENEHDLFDGDLIRSHGSFHRTQPLLPDAHILWDGIKKFHGEPIILTGIPRSVPEYVNQKTEWVEEHFGPGITVICCRSQDKFLHGKSWDILIDDRIKYRQYWVDMGGIFIHHVSAIKTLQTLESMYEYKERFYDTT